MTEARDFHQKLTLRDATAEDCQLILSFIRELAEYEDLAHEVKANAELLAETLFGDQPAAQVTLADWAGESAGFALYFRNYSTFLARPGIYLEDLFVRPAYRGKGIGLALLSHIAKRVIDNNGGRLDWWVLNWNEPAIGFYERLGAVKMGDWMPMRLEGAPLSALAESANRRSGRAGQPDGR